MSSRPRTLAGIPWDQKINESNFNLLLSESAIFKNSEKKKDIMRKFFLFNSTFPFYIPPECYSFDALSFREKCPNGQFWAVTSLSLLYNHSQTLFTWEQFGKQDSSELLEEKCRPNISTSMLSKLFPTSIPQCDKAANFLLDFGVLVQLPFKPVLLHQWLVAAYHEALIFETEVMHFFFFPYVTKEQTTMKELFEHLERLDQYLNKGFNWLQKRVKSNINLNVGDVDELVETIQAITRFLLFWLPGCSDYERGFRRISNRFKTRYLGEDPKTCITWEGENFRPILSSRNFVYNLLCWSIPEERRQFFGNTEDSPDGDGVEKIFRSIISKEAATANTGVFLLGLTFKLKIGIKEKEFLRNDREWCECAQNYAFWKDKVKMFRVREEERGILGKIFFLQAKRSMKLSMLQLLKRTVQLANLKMNSTVLLVLQHEMNHVLGTGESNNDFEPPGEKLKYSAFKEPPVLYDILRELHRSAAEVNQSVYRDHSCDSLAKNLQDRIKKLVLNALAARYENPTFNTKDIEREWLMGQYYLLPCFVATFLDLSRTDKMKMKILNRFGQFIHLLIADYEEIGFKGLNSLGVSDSIDTCSALFALHNMRRPALLLSYFETIERAFYLELDNNNHVMAYFKKNKMFRALYEVLDFPEGTQDLLREPPVPWMWLLLEFFKRMEKTLRACTIENDVYLFGYSSKSGPTEDEMTELIKLMWVAGTDWSAFKSDEIFGPIEVLRSILCFHKDSLLSVFTINFNEEADLLPTKKILRIAFDLALQHAGKQFEISSSMKPTISRLDMAFHSFLTKANNGQMWALRKFATDFFGDDSTVSYDFALNKATICYVLSLQSVGNDKKVLFDRRSPRWFFPIKHCRWCGSVEPQGPTFLPCFSCCSVSYPDEAVFCSLECKNEASDSHQQEHQSFGRFKATRVGLNILDF